MNRRELLTVSSAGAVVGITGCLDAVEGSDRSTPKENESGDTEKGNAEIGLRCIGVYADEVDREFISGEYLLLKNGSDESLDVSGFVVEYPSDQTHRMGELVLEPGAQLALLSRSGQNTTLQSSPPVYLRYAGFAVESPSSVLGESGTVGVRNARGSLVTDVEYEHFGCDGGTVTTGAGDEIECQH